MEDTSHIPWGDRCSGSMRPWEIQVISHGLIDVVDQWDLQPQNDSHHKGCKLYQSWIWSHRVGDISLKMNSYSKQVMLPCELEFVLIIMEFNSYTTTNQFQFQKGNKLLPLDSNPRPCGNDMEAKFTLTCLQIKFINVGQVMTPHF